MSSLPPDSEPTLGKTIRTVSFWAVLVVGTIALVQFAQERRSNSVEVSYTRFANELDRGMSAQWRSLEQGGFVDSSKPR